MDSLTLKQRIAAVQDSTLKFVTMASDSLVFLFRRPGAWIRFDTFYPILYAQAGKAAVRYNIENFAKAPPVTFHRCLDCRVVETDIGTEHVQIKFENGDILAFATEAVDPERSGEVRSETADMLS